MKITVHNDKGEYQYEHYDIESAIEYINKLIQKAFDEKSEDVITIQVIEAFRALIKEGISVATSNSAE